MNLNVKILGSLAFVSYFGMDTLTTCIGVCNYGADVESNPAMSLALGSGGIAIFILVN